MNVTIHLPTHLPCNLLFALWYKQEEVTLKAIAQDCRLKFKHCMKSEYYANTMTYTKILDMATKTIQIHGKHMIFLT
jgi:hypothetical protein